MLSHVTHTHTKPGRMAVCPSEHALARFVFPGRRAAAHVHAALWPCGTAGPVSLALTPLCPGCSPPKKSKKLCLSSAVYSSSLSTLHRPLQHVRRRATDIPTDLGLPFAVLEPFALPPFTSCLPPSYSYHANAPGGVESADGQTGLDPLTC